jgi:hypothetical protein
MSVFDALQSDTYHPSQLKPSLAQFNPWQTYTLVCVDREWSSTKTEYYPSTNLGIQPVYDPINHTYTLLPLTSPIINNTSGISKRNDWIAIQSFSPAGIKINFLDYANQYHE